MNITRENIDELNLVLKMQFTEEDYAPKVDKALKEYRKKARIPGFRPGMVPTGLIKQMYGKAVLAEEVNKLMSESLHNYLSQEKLPILGEPLPSQEEQSVMDFDNDKSFEFKFDIGLAPKVDLSVLGQLEVPYYQIDVTDSMIDEMVENYARQFGAPQEVEQVEDGQESLRGSFEETDEQGQPIANGHRADDVLVVLSVVKDKELVESMKGAKLGDSFVMNTPVSFPNDTDRAAMLQIDKEQLAERSPYYRYTISRIEHFAPAVVDQDLFDRVFGAQEVADLEAFRAKIAEQIVANFLPASDYRFGLDARKALLNKLSLDLPTAFLRRWLRMANAENKDLTEEIFEKEYPSFEESTKWQLVKDEIFRSRDLKIEQNELIDEAVRGIEQQFAQYGMPAGSIPRENLIGYAQQMLAKEEEARRVYDRLYEHKVVQAIKAEANPNTELLSREAFDALFGKEAEQED